MTDTSSGPSVTRWVLASASTVCHSALFIYTYFSDPRMRWTGLWGISELAGLRCLCNSQKICTQGPKWGRKVILQYECVDLQCCCTILYALVLLVFFREEAALEMQRTIKMV